MIKATMAAMAYGHPISIEMNELIKSKTNAWVPLDVDKNPMKDAEKLRNSRGNLGKHSPNPLGKFLKGSVEFL